MQRIREFDENVPYHLECFPLLAFQSFKMVLKELKIPHVACEGEADNQIAVLARQWCCPVISCDNDMYIFDLPGGFINFYDLNYKTTDINCEIPTKVYLSSRFQEISGMSSSLLPLAATLLGSAYAEIDDCVKNKFFKSIGASLDVSYLSKNLNAAFDLLRNVSSVSAGVSLLLDCVDQTILIDKATDLKSKINTSIQMFKVQNTFENFSIDKYFEGKVSSRRHKCLPNRIVESIRTCILSGLPSDIIIGSYT